MENKNALTLVGIFSLIVGLVGGYFVGNNRGVVLTEQRLLPVIETIFPKPADFTRSLTGKVASVYGTSLTLEVDDPDDYLPHVDGSPRKTEMRTVKVSANTEYSRINYQALDAQGNPSRTQASLSDIDVGEVIVVRSAENIRDAQEFEAIEVQLLRY